MTTVVQLKSRRKVPTDSATTLAIIDATLGEVFVRLAEQYGAHAVTTVALKYIAEAVEHVRLKHRPVEDRWIVDLAKRFNDAIKGKR